MNKIKAIAFDLGNVLFSFDYNIAIDKIKERISLTKEDVVNKLMHSDFTLSFEKGLISPEDFFKEFNAAFAVDLTYDYFFDIWCKIFSPKNEIINFARAVSKKFPLYLISNINKLHFDYLHQEYQYVFSLFKGLVLSYEVKSVKPEFKIYQRLKSLSRVDFNNIVYIDDRRDLTDQAKQFNLHCIQFQNKEKLIEDLESLDISI